MFIGIVLIFLNAMGWLSLIYEKVFFEFDSTTISSIVLVLVIVGFIVYVTASPKTEKKKE
jgi:predicted membrane channel-forming protein YqfA (hemolysin III family)